jgi:hypothetical protein
MQIGKSGKRIVNNTSPTIAISPSFIQGKMRYRLLYSLLGMIKLVTSTNL